MLAYWLAVMVALNCACTQETSHFPVHKSCAAPDVRGEAHHDAAQPCEQARSSRRVVTALLTPGKAQRATWSSHSRITGGGRRLAPASALAPPVQDLLRWTPWCLSPLGPWCATLHIPERKRQRLALKLIERWVSRRACSTAATTLPLHKCAARRTRQLSARREMKRRSAARLSTARSWAWRSLRRAGIALSWHWQGGE